MATKKHGNIPKAATRPRVLDDTASANEVADSYRPRNAEGEIPIATLARVAGSIVDSSGVVIKGDELRANQTVQGALQAAQATPIADAAAAYALTGVTAGTVYETDDTGQIMEYLGDTKSKELRANIIITGGTYNNGGSQPLTSGSETFEIPNTIAAYPAIFAETDTLNGNLWSFEQIGNKWVLKDNFFALATHFQSVEDADSVHPADATWEITGSGLTVPTITRSETNESIPNNWKINGVISVYDNDEKQLLTNLPDTQQVEVVGEGGRVERYGDNAGILTSFNVSDAGTPADWVFSESLAVPYVWDGTSYKGEGSSFAAEVIFNTDHWELRTMSTSNFNSPTCTVSDHPADVVGAWVVQGSATGTIADGGVTRAPETMESNWDAIVNTIELYGNVAYTTITINGVLIEPINTDIRVGWIKPTDSMLSNFGNPWYVQSIDGFAESSNTGNFQGGDGMTLPQPFPSGATVVIRNT